MEENTTIPDSSDDNAIVVAKQLENLENLLTIEIKKVDLLKSNNLT